MMEPVDVNKFPPLNYGLSTHTYEIKKHPHNPPHVTIIKITPFNKKSHAVKTSIVAAILKL